MNTSKWDTICSAVQGLGHVEQNLPCQDKTATAEYEGCRVIALADGAGSARLSHAGATATVQTLCHYVSREFERLYATADVAAVQAAVLQPVLQELSSLAAELDCRVQELASTFLLAAVKEGRYILMHLGDGLIAYRKQGKLLVASAPVNGEYANSTIFTTSSHACQAIRLFKGDLGAIDGFVLMSDGSCSSLYNKATATPAPVLGWLMQLCTYLPAHVVEQGVTDSLESEVRHATADDCSLAILARRESAFTGVAALPHATLARLLALPEFAASSRRRVRVYVRVMECLKRPIYLSAIARQVHLKLKHLRRKVQFLLACRLVEQLPDGRYVSRARL